MLRKNQTIKPSDPAAVDAFMKALKHPLADLAQALRRAILAVAPVIGEEINGTLRRSFMSAL